MIVQSLGKLHYHLLLKKFILYYGHQNFRYLDDEFLVGEA